MLFNSFINVFLALNLNRQLKVTGLPFFFSTITSNIQLCCFSIYEPLLCTMIFMIFAMHPTQSSLYCVTVTAPSSVKNFNGILHCTIPPPHPSKNISTYKINFNSQKLIQPEDTHWTLYSNMQQSIILRTVWGNLWLQSMFLFFIPMFLGGHKKQRFQ